MNKQHFGIIGLLIMLLALPFGASAQQQATQPPASRDTLLAGKLEEVSADFIVVAGQTIDTTQAQRPDNLMLGAWVEVQLGEASHHALVAKQVRYPQHKELTFIGAVESLNPDSMRVAGLQFDTLQAKFDDRDQLAVGAKVEIDFIQREGKSIALKVDVDDDNPIGAAVAPRLKGVITKIGDDNTLNIGGMIVNLENMDVSRDLFVGAFVVVDFAYENSTLTPVTVGFYDDDDYEIHGFIEAITATTITVNGLVFDITRAEIDSDDGLQVGDFVEVEYIVTDAGLVALEVDEHDDDDDFDDFDDDDDTLHPCVPTRPEGWQTYRIRPGDTLSGIAAASGTNLQQLIAVNCITNANVVVVGTTIYVKNKVQQTPDRPTPAPDNPYHDDDDNDYDDDDDHHHVSPTQPPYHDDDDNGDHDDDDNGDHDDDDDGDRDDDDD